MIRVLNDSGKLLISKSGRLISITIPDENDAVSRMLSRLEMEGRVDNFTDRESFFEAHQQAITA